MKKKWVEWLKNADIRLLGFRSGIKWKKTLSSIYLVFCALYAFSIVLTSTHSTLWNVFVEKVQGIVTLAFLTSPYLLLSESPIKDKIPLFRARSTAMSVVGGVVVLFAFCIINSFFGLCYEQEAVDVPETIVEETANWANSELGKILPHPGFADTKVMQDTSEIFGFEVLGKTEEDFEEYKNRCKTLGFTFESEEVGAYYRAENAEYYMIELCYWKVDHSIRANVVKRSLSADGVKKLEFSETEIALACGEEKQSSLIVEKTETATITGFQYVSGDESIVKITEVDSATGTFSVVGLKEGTAEIYAQTTDGVIKSSAIPVTVTQMITGIKYASNEVSLEVGGDPAQIGLLIETSSQKKISKNVFLATSEDMNVVTVSVDETGDHLMITPKTTGETYISVSTNDGKILGERIKVKVTEPIVNETLDVQEDTHEVYEEKAYSGPVAYVTPTGKKYHRSSSCAGKNAREISLEDAQSSYDPCKKCA